MASVGASTSVFNATTNTATYTTASFTPSAGELVLVSVAVTGATDATPTLTDANGDTYTLVGSALKATSADRQYFYVGDQFASANARTIQVSFAASASGAIIHIFRVSGMLRTGASAIRQSAKTENAGNVLPTVTLGSAPLATNPCLTTLHGASTAPTHNGNWTLGANTSYGTPATRHTSWHRSGETATTINWSTTATSAHSIFFVELDETAAGDPNRTASMSATDAADTFNASAYTVVQTRLSATDATDTFNAQAKTIIQGRMSATDAGSDVFAAPTKVRVTSRLSATEAFSDTFAASAANRVTARLSATDATDSFVATGYNVVTGRLSATDATDSFVASSYAVVTGRLSATDAPDVFVAESGLPVRRGSMSATDAADTFAATTQVIVTGSLAATDTPDTFASTAQVRVTAALSATDAPDIFAASASVLATFITATLNATDAPDTFAASATVIAVSVSAPDVPVITVDPGAGWGKGRGKKQKPPYIQLSNDWWDARERYLQSLQPEIVTEPSPEFSLETPAIDELEPTQYSPTQLVTYSVKRTELIAALPLATTMKQLRSFGDELRKINRLILQQKLLSQRIEQAAREEQEALRAERRAKRQHAIRRKRRLLATLELSRSLLSLYSSQ